MARLDKIEAVDEIKARIEGSTVAIVTQYQGITVDEVTDLRSRLRNEGVTFKVYKNTLAKLALEGLELSEAVAYMEGPIAWAFCEDPVAPAKILKEFSKDVEAIVMRGGILDGKPVTSDQLNSLADLPSQDQLRAQVVGTIAMPLRNLVGVLSAVPRNMVNVLDQIRKQKEEAEAA
ncbi:MAG: 50S ribosomal protein L10 [Candidatus Hydrogenedentes bacterium]|nr:50S ribosomal protein L10 [Candidatus Hydrogenedentota bacterium]